jgi:hypothetical protein
MREIHERIMVLEAKVHVQLVGEDGAHIAQITRADGTVDPTKYKWTDHDGNVHINDGQINYEFDVTPHDTTPGLWVVDDDVPPHVKDYGARVREIRSSLPYFKWDTPRRVGPARDSPADADPDIHASIRNFETEYQAKRKERERIVEEGLEGIRRGGIPVWSTRKSTGHETPTGGWAVSRRSDSYSPPAARGGAGVGATGKWHGYVPGWGFDGEDDPDVPGVDLYDNDEGVGGAFGTPAHDEKGVFDATTPDTALDPRRSRVAA